MQNCDVIDNYMFSIWWTTRKCKILHLIFQNFYDNQWEKLWENILFEQSFVSTPFPLLKMLTSNAQKLRQDMLSVCNIVYRETVNFKESFENSHNILSLILWKFLKKRKIRFYACGFKKLECGLISLIMLRYTLS